MAPVRTEHRCIGRIIRIHFAGSSETGASITAAEELTQVPCEDGRLFARSEEDPFKFVIAHNI